MMKKALLEITKLFLEQTSDFCVDTASSASGGLEMLSLSPYCAVVSDYEMPEMDGLAFLKEVRREYPDLPFIIFTGKGREDVVIEALNNGVSYYLQKGGEPVSQFAELSHKITLAAEKHEMEEQLRLDELRMEALVDFHEKSTMQFPDFMAYTIEEVTRLSASRYGFIAFVDESEEHLSMYGWSEQTLKDNQMPVKKTKFSLHETGLWADAIRGKCPVIVNDFTASRPEGRQIPKGHVPLTRYMGVPLIDNDGVVLLAGVGNKSAPYNESDVRQVTLIMSGLWKIIKQKRTDEELRDAYEKIEESKNYLQGKIEHLCQSPYDGPLPELTNLVCTEYLQEIQDLFSDSCNVGSLITDRNGTPITCMSNVCEVCTIIRGNAFGARDCRSPVGMAGKEGKVPVKPICTTCPLTGLAWACVPIGIGGRDAAYWHIGQVRTPELSSESLVAYARKAGIDEHDIVDAFERMEVMPRSQFEKVVRLLWIAGKSMSTLMYGKISMAKDAL